MEEGSFFLFDMEEDRRRTLSMTMWINIGWIYMYFYLFGFLLSPLGFRVEPRMKIPKNDSNAIFSSSVHLFMFFLFFSSFLFVDSKVVVSLLNFFSFSSVIFTSFLICRRLNLFFRT